jgi:aryl-alcohol dehydrogenase-like predicted oxidoreductase
VARERRRLGRTEIEISPVGLGCWQFGGSRGIIGGYWGEVPQPVVNDIVREAIDSGIDWFDTAEIYGRGRSEQALSLGLRAAGKQNGEVVIATKWWPTLRTASNIGATIDERLRALSPYSIDLYQIHQPFSLSSVESEMKAMAELLKAGKIGAVGVSNFSAHRMEKAHAALAASGLPLVSNQMRYSLVDRHIEQNGVIDTARKLGVSIIAYSPLGQGILSGKFHDDPDLVKARPGLRKLKPAFGRRGLERTRPLVTELRAIAKAYGATAAQIALAWLVRFHGDLVFPIPGATRPDQIRDHAGAMVLALTARELARLDELSRPFV